MALQKTKEFKGVDANYWKIVKEENNYLLDKTVVSLGLYKDSTTREEDVKNFLKTERITVDGAELTREQIYTKIKEPKIVDEVETNWFADAVDA